MAIPKIRTLDVETRAATVGTYDAASRTQRVVFFTEADAIKTDLDGQRYIERWHPEGCDLTRANGVGVSLFWNHGNGATRAPVLIQQRDVIGNAEPGSWVLTADQGECTVRFIQFAEDETDTQDDRRAAMKVAHGYSRGISPGYRKIETRVEASQEPDGLPILHVLRSEIVELSAAPIQADAGAGTRSMEETTMATAAEPTAQDIEARAAELDAAKKAARAEGARHSTEIRALCTRHGIDLDAAATAGEPEAMTSIRAALSDPETKLPRVKELVLDVLAKRTESQGIRSGHTEITRDEVVTEIRAMEASLSQRAGLPLDAETRALADSLQSYDLIEIGRRNLELHGVSTRGVSSRSALARMILHQAPGKDIQIRAGAHVAGDFGSLNANVMNKVLAGEKALSGEYGWFEQCGTRNDFADYTPRTFVEIGGLGELPVVNEGAEYGRATFGDGQIQYTVQKRGIELALTEEALLGNNMGAWVRQGRMWVRSSIRTKSAVAAAAIFGNPTMADGVALFASAAPSWDKKKKTNSGGHNNLSTSGGAPTPVRVRELDQKLRSAKDRDGAVVGMRGYRWLGAPDWATTLDLYYNGSYVANPADPTTIVTVPLPDDRRHYIPSLAGTNPWVLMTADTMGFEFAYLQGEGGPVVIEYAEQRTDARIYHCREVFGARVLDSAPFAMNPGA